MLDIVASIAWLAANATLLAATSRVVRCCFGKRPLPESIAHGIVFGWSAIVANSLLLQSFGMLSSYRLQLSTALTVAGLAWWLAGRQDFNASSGKLPFARERWLRRTMAGNLRYQSLTCIVWSLLALVGLAKCILLSLTAFPADWDSLAYHLPLVDHWIQSGNLYTPNCAFWYCPANSELIAYWLVSPFSGDFWFAFNNIPCTILLAISSVKLLAEFRIVRPLRHLAAMAIVATNVTWRHLGSNENDIAVVALFVTCLWYAARTSHSNRPANAIFCSLAFGLLIGTKYPAIGYAGVAGIAVIGLLILNHRMRDVPRVSAYGLLGGAAIGGYWYLRNYLATGTPIFPKGLLGSEDLWAQMRPESSSSSLLHNSQSEVFPMLCEAIYAQGGLFHIASFVLLPSSIITMFVLGACEQLPFRQRSLRIWLAGVLLLATLVFVITPNVVETAPGSLNMLRSKYHCVRLGIAAISMAPLALAISVSDLLWITTATRNRLLPAVTPVVFQYASHTYRILKPQDCLIVAIGFSMILLQTYSHVARNITPGLQIVMAMIFVAVVAAVFIRSFISPTTLVIAMIVFFPAITGWRSSYWHAHYDRTYSRRFKSDIFTTKPSPISPDATICVCDYQYYPFFGSRRQNSVCRPLWIPDSQSLADYLTLHRATVLVTRHIDNFPQRRYAAVPKVLEANPNAFVSVFSDQTFHCVKVNTDAISLAAVRENVP